LSGAPGARTPTGARRETWLALAAVVGTVAIVAGLLLTSVPPAGFPAESPVAAASAAQSAGAAATRGPAGSPGDSPDPGGAWAAADPPAFALPADLEAEVRDAAGVDPGSAFTLTATGSSDARELATRLVFEPGLPFAIAAGAAPASVRLVPEAPLEPGRVYRARLAAPDGALQGTWAFHVQGPIHVVTTVPGDRTTDVPTDAGIEVTFDQDGVRSMADAFSISPAVEGRFERSGRTQVFVPDRLAPQTIYTVTLRRGLGRDGGDVTLEQDVTFRFSTAGEGDGRGRAWFLEMDRPVIEASPNERAIVGLTAEDWSDEGDGLPSSVSLLVYRYPSRAVAAAAIETILAHPGWTDVARVPLDTAGLDRVMSMRVKLARAEDDPGGTVARLPARLPRGWYLVDAGPAHEAQAVLQVTDVSAWVSVLTDRTVAWVNDTVTGRPLAAAKVAVLGGRRLGVTDADGLMVADTVAELVPPAASPEDDERGAAGPILLVTARSGRSVLVPLGLPGETEIFRGEWWKDEPLADESWWSLLESDRTLYRSTDHLNAWGLLRRRAGGGVPDRVDLRLVSTDVTAPPWAEATAVPGSTGARAFATTLELVDVPEGSYYLEALVDGRVAARRWLAVGTIQKPLYRIAVTTDRHAVASGDPVEVTTTATFFEGQPVPGLRLLGCDQHQDEDCASHTTDTAGSFGDAWEPRSDDDGQVVWRGYDVRSVAEESDIGETGYVLVFPSTRTFEAAAGLAGRRLTVAGTLREVDFPRLERELAEDRYEDRPGGAVVAGAAIGIRVTELVPVRRLVRRTYDYIAKQVVPVYEYDVRRQLVGTWTRTTDAAGSFRLRTRVGDGSHEYEVEITARDPQGRSERDILMAGQPDTASQSWQPGPRFERVNEDGYSVGDRVRLSIVDGRTETPSGGRNRYLYLVAQRGLRDAYVSRSPRFARTFGEADVPRVFVVGVRFTGSTYTPKAATWLDFDIEDRALSVTLDADADAYRPGGTVTVTTRVTDGRGRGVPATVVLRAVDEKLFAMGGAGIEEPLPALYGGVTSGVLRFTATHQVPVSSPGEGEGGDATGGDVRDDFRDSVLFRRVETDAAGIATTTFRVSDDLTSWHVSATALTDALQAGEGGMLVPVRLPFFVEAVLADAYLAGDRPVMSLRAYGTGLRAGDPVEFRVSAPSLGLGEMTVTGTALEPVAVPLPALTTGTHEVTIAGRSTAAGHAGGPLADAIHRSIRVVDTRNVIRRSAAVTPGGVGGIPGGDGQTTLTFADGGRGRFTSLLEGLADSTGTRADEAVAQRAARTILMAAYGRDAGTLPPAADLSRFGVVLPSDPGECEEDDDCDPLPEVTVAGLPLLPWTGPDPVLAARAALAASDQFRTGDLARALEWTRASPETSRELRILAIAGLAALGVDVSADMEALRGASDLSPRERLYAALAAEAFGDHRWALALERGLLEEAGEARGPWTRLGIAGTPSGRSLDTALLAVVAAGVGDPVADSLLAYVEANPPATDLAVLETVGFVRRRLPHLAAAPASIAWTLDGQRHVVELRAGAAETVELSAAQRAAVAVEVVSGTPTVTATWLEPHEVDAPTAPEGELERRVTPPGAIAPGAVVRVVLAPTLPSTAAECWEVSDTLPSGLAPVMESGWDGSGVAQGEVGPDAIVGQRVVFTQCTSDLGRRLVYRARVVTAGDYRWEPAVVQRMSDRAIVAIVPAMRVTITPP
jgi:hypothetical protein